MALAGTEFTYGNYDTTDEQKRGAAIQAASHIPRDDLLETLQMLGIVDTPIDPNRVAPGGCKRGHQWMRDNTYITANLVKNCRTCQAQLKRERIRT